jgi:hypothetical protein
VREDSSRACVHPRLSLSLSLWTDRRAKQVLARFLSVRKLSHKPTQTHPTTLPKAGADSLRDRTGWRRQAPRIVTGRGNDTRERTPLTHTARDLGRAPNGDIGGLRSGQGEQGVTRGATAVPAVMLMCHLCMPGGIEGQCELPGSKGEAEGRRSREAGAVAGKFTTPHSPRHTGMAAAIPQRNADRSGGAREGHDAQKLRAGNGPPWGWAAHSPCAGSPPPSRAPSAVPTASIPRTT